MMIKITFVASLGRLLLMASLILMLVFCSTGFADQLKFGDWVGVAEADPLTAKEHKKIGTFAPDGISIIWLSAADSGQEKIQLTLESKKLIASDYFLYRIDKVGALTISSAIKGCESSCLIEYIPQTSELIQSMKGGLRIRFEYDSYPEITQNPTFSLRGFTKAFNWLVSK
jgi:hypothetical protein